MARMRTHTKRPRRNRLGIQHLWGFDNGRLASAVPDADQKDRWELSVRVGSDESVDSATTSPDVSGALRPADVRRILRQIEAL
jgi:hypothetical protein